jgi:3-hydroxybutyryl-CoA dehydrogenase
MEIKNVFVVGAGTMGNGIAQTAATRGFDVTLMDVLPEQLENARSSIKRSVEKLASKGALTEEAQAAALGIRMVGDLERLERSRSGHRGSHRGVILASNTSSISITKIGGATQRPDKVIGMHFMNPVPLMTLVEIIRGLATSDDTRDTAFEVCQQMGKTPIEANDSPGFISNRILCPMINEAIFALQEGIGTPEAIDTGHEAGHEPSHGPAALCDLIGLDVV